MKDIVKPRIFEVQPYRPGRPIDEVKRELKLKNVIKLASNENPYPPAPAVIKAIRKAAESVNRYPDGGCFELRRVLAKHLAVTPGQIIFGNGSDEVIVMAVRAFVNEGDEVVIAKPSFLIYDIASRLQGAVVRSVALKDFRYDLQGMLNAVNGRTRIIFIGNPDNPAGTFVSESQLVAFLRKVPSKVLVFVDEAYFEFVDDASYPDTIKLLRTFPNLIVTRTFSKIYGLAGLRLGYGVASEELVDILNRLREPFNVNSLAQAAAVACLKSQRYYQRIGRETARERQKLYAAFSKLGLTYVPTVTNFVLLDVGRDSTAVAGALLKRGVIVRDMAAWGLSNFIRVTIGTPSENRRFWAALKTIL